MLRFIGFLALATVCLAQAPQIGVDTPPDSPVEVTPPVAHDPIGITVGLTNRSDRAIREVVVEVRNKSGQVIGSGRIDAGLGPRGKSRAGITIPRDRMKEGGATVSIVSVEFADGTTWLKGGI
jgi:hypothetical protein